MRRARHDGQNSRRLQRRTGRRDRRTIYALIGLIGVVIAAALALQRAEAAAA
jgi:hypothetical protein